MIPIIPYRLVVCVSMLMLILASVRDNGFAMDESGCFTCHQYPGLTRPETPEGFKVFHIDEERYLQSPHGKTDCRKCHTTVNKVPHVGETSVNCTNGCHLAEKDKKLIADFDLKTLHDNEQFYITRLADGSACQVCHRLYPHQSNELARAFINMHIGFMTCETCHINREEYTKIDYEWTGSETADFAGKPFGARFNPKLGDDAETAHFISRISVFSEENGEKRSLHNTWDAEKAEAYLAKANQWTSAEKKERLAYFHKDIHKNAVSVTCNECHSADSILDFEALGFSPRKAHDLIDINIKGLVTKYEIFYFPDMFR